MGTLASSPSQFVAGTKAKAAEVNAKFTSIFNAIAGGDGDVYVNGVQGKRTASASVDITANASHFSVAHIVPTALTYRLMDSTSRMCALSSLTVQGTLSLTSGAEVLVL